MKYRDPYQIVKRRYVTEKSTTLESLKDAESNLSVRRCKSPKYVFIVDGNANKIEIADAVEEIYKDKNVKVKKVNTVNVKSKTTRRIRSYGKTNGSKAAFKKAIVTLEPKDSLD
ncbi:MAG: 50S ribosomal protein L23 [Chlamydiia bacterium]|nr:50S ribosomal protein L23 [Chlamydiia bacterium]